MADVASRELRNHTRAVLARVEAGEEIRITIDGRPVARLEPLPARARFMRREAFVASVLSQQADAELARELSEIAPDTTDDLGW